MTWRSGLPATAGVVLAGGRSTRMGRSKAWLEWHGSTLLHRAAAILARTVGGPVVVVAAPGQELPPLPPDVSVVADPVEGLGPMQGLAAGLAAVADRAGTAFVCSTDMPFLHPAFVRRVVRALPAGADVALPVARGYRQPLAAAYRTGLAGLVEDLLAEGDLRPGMLFEHCEVVRLDDERLLADAELARLDPALESVVNVNSPDDYAAARERPQPEIVVECGRGPHRVRAATLGIAAAEVGLKLGPGVVVVLNGDQTAPDERLPLVAGDTVSLP
ncbi:molybdenum cofactor guanylyltransferase [Herbidospora yilanensis]|uniref:molybdenum cofactor guanylyltransferase n=1 Tax=Herbidospora yilanensis TaxID=354426 RepID=UPI000780EBA4|nr:molybdenum cofactor guanylyltransferase [Herbidospora yilanensis]